MTRQTCLRKYMKVAVIVVICMITANRLYKKTRFYFYKPIFIPFAERLNSEHVVLIVGETYTVRLMNVNKRVSYKSSDFRVAVVMFTGKVYARQVGTTVINVTFGKKEAKCLVRVIDINKKKKKIEVGERYTLKIRGATDTVEWKSENEHVVTIDEEGIMTGQNVGIAVITGKVHGKTLRCQVTVKENKKQS